MYHPTIKLETYVLHLLAALVRQVVQQPMAAIRIRLWIGVWVCAIVMAAGCPGAPPGDPNDAGSGPGTGEDDRPPLPISDQNNDAGSPSTDAGNPAVDAGNPAVDAGNPAVDAGNPAVDAGNPAVDAGNPAVDAGNPAVDAGNPAVDAGNPAVDAGNPTPDAGNPTPDAGNPIPDAGNQTVDAGNPGVDAGNPTPDAGNPTPDAGNPTPDAGNPGVDAGNVNHCNPNPCLHGGGCTDGVNGYTCDCTGTGYSGDTCQNNINDCNPNPCLHGGGCTDGINGYTCDCTGTGYSGDTCQNNINDCNPNPCLHGGGCTDGINGYTCDCTGTGYSGDTCQNNINDCNPNPCLHGGGCTDGVNGYTCDCTGTGYSGDTCQNNINDCNPNPCLHGGGCTDGVNGYTCDCTGTGYSGDTCQNNINDCNPNPCLHGGGCTDGVNGYTCDCTGTGYSGDTCQNNINDCNPNPCLHGGGCTDGVNSFDCDCTGTGYSGDTCQNNINDCNPNPCLHGGDCTDGVNGFSCDCTGTGYTGSTCDQIIGPQWSCDETYYDAGDGCDCGCNIVDLDCVDEQLSSCEYEHCSVGNGLEPTDPTQCVSADSLGWACTLTDYGDGLYCDCGCGIVDADCSSQTASCDATACISPLITSTTDNSQCVDGWTCSASYYDGGDGCDCGCGVLDPDCPDNLLTSCEYDYCDAGDALSPSDPTQCVSADTLGWTCTLTDYGDGLYCDCGCGIVDSDCSSQTASCDATGCISPMITSTTDNSQCVDGWTCSASYYDGGDGCDCGCGVLDPDCPDNLLTSCEYDYCDAGDALSPSDPTQCVSADTLGWTCTLTDYGDGLYCDCGCGIVDADCSSQTASCDATACLSPLVTNSSDNSQCVSGWTCNASYYAALDGCDCGCGIVDPDCPDNSSLSCSYDNCPTGSAYGSVNPTQCEGTCDGDCLAANNTECTCQLSDPCGWSGDGFCDSACATSVTSPMLPFDDSADCP